MFDEMEKVSKWPKILPDLNEEQIKISNDFMHFWHTTLSSQKKFSFIEKFNQTYVINRNRNFSTTLEIGAGLGEHLNYEKLTQEQLKNYVALEIRSNMANEIKRNFPEVSVYIGDCQKKIPYENNYFDRILAIHVLEHLPNLPETIKECYRLCSPNGSLEVVIPCEGGYLYSFARKISAQRLFQKRYKQSYQWFIEREHINQPHEIIEELKKYFYISSKTFFPFMVPSVNLNLCIGLSLKPKNKENS